MKAASPPRKSLRKPTSRYHHGDLRSALVATAWRVVEHQGPAALSLRAVADALGVSHAAPAHHFRDKEELLDALRVQAWAGFADALEQGGAQASAPLHAMGMAYVAFATAHPRRLQLMFGPSTHGPSAPVQAEAARAWGALVAAVARHIGAERAADPATLGTLAVAAWAQVHGLALLWTDVTLPPELPRGEAATALHARVLEVLIAGMAAPAAPATPAPGGTPGRARPRGPGGVAGG